MNLPNSETAIKMGGVSDGGGNAVGDTLFDFYENIGSLEITVDQLLQLEPKAQKMIEWLNSQVPAINYPKSGGLGDLLKKSLSSKKIYLESKEISSEACVNHSMLATDKQTIVACQSDSELRIVIKWMLNVNEINRAGLINHELILAWARRISTDSKEEVEQKVRELNRKCFSADGKESQLAMAVSQIFNVKAYNKQRFHVANNLASRVKIALADFCENPMINITSQFEDVWDDEFLMNGLDVPSNLKAMKEVSEASRRGIDMDSAISKQHAICTNYYIDHTPIREPNLSVLPRECLNSLESAVEGTARYLTLAPTKTVNADDIKYVLKSSLIKAKSTFLLCQSLRKNELENRLFMSQEKPLTLFEETYAEALHYFRYKLKQRGLHIVFSENTDI